MRFAKILILVIVALMIWQPRLPIVTTDQVTTEITLYAHTDPSVTKLGGRVLTISSNTTSPHYADARDGLTFVLVPALSAPLHILGTISIYVWFRSQENLRGTLQVKLSDLRANASVTEIRSSSVTTAVSVNPYLVIFGLGTSDYMLGVGSTLMFEVRFSPVRAVPVMLLWDDPATPSRLIMQVKSLPKITLVASDIISGKTSTIFPENDTSATMLLAKVTVEDPFRGTNVRSVLLTVTNSSGFSLITNAPMNLTSQTAIPYGLEYSYPIAVRSGRFNFTVSVQDAAKRTFEKSILITVTQYHTLAVINLDSKRRPLSGFNISFFAGNQFIEDVETDSTGIATSRVPDSRAVGPITLRANRDGLIVGSRTFDIQSNVTITVEWPLYDWDVSVRFPLYDIPVAAAQASLYLNDTFVASSMSDQNGIAHFSAVPLGDYKITVTWGMLTQNLTNVVPSPNAVTVVKIGDALTMTLLIATVAGVIAILAVCSVIRRRSRTRSFRHVAELIGGTFPQSAIVMIVGPSGSGKSLLLQNMLADALRAGRRCVYASNCEPPSKVKDRLERMGLDVRKLQDSKMLGFVDAYSGTTGTVSSEKFSVPSPRDLTSLGIRLTSCLEELGEPGDVFFDSLVPVVASGAFERGFNFIEYYGARTKNSGGAFLYVASTTIDPELLSRLEELADLVLQTERYTGRGGIRGRLLVKKARVVEHEAGWVGFKIRSDGRMELRSLPPNTP